nr:futalosine hydrolase [Paenibacillus sp. 1001270B_150601_E10]
MTHSSPSHSLHMDANAIASVTVKRVLIMTSVAAERDAVLRGLQQSAATPSAAMGSSQLDIQESQTEAKLQEANTPRVEFDVEIAGVGAAMAAVHTTRALMSSSHPYDLVINAGIAGGFVGRAEIGSLVVASEIICADLGAESEEGFISVDELGFGSARIPVSESIAAKLAEALHEAQLTAVHAPILTLSTATGTKASAEELLVRVPEAAAEAMEGYGVAAAAKTSSLPVLELRAISNAIGPRDRSAWRIGDALQALEAASAVLKEVLR